MQIGRIQSFVAGRTRLFYQQNFAATLTRRLTQLLVLSPFLLHTLPRWLQMVVLRRPDSQPKSLFSGFRIAHRPQRSHSTKGVCVEIRTLLLRKWKLCSLQRLWSARNTSPSSRQTSGEEVYTKSQTFPFLGKPRLQASTNYREINWLPGSSQKVGDGWYLPFCSQRTAMPELHLTGPCMCRAEMT